MLENPTDENVVRWGNDGDSFVVLEVRCSADDEVRVHVKTNESAEREIYEAHPTQTLQAQQLR